MLWGCRGYEVVGFRPGNLRTIPLIYARGVCIKGVKALGALGLQDFMAVRLEVCRVQGLGNTRLGAWNFGI